MEKLGGLRTGNRLSRKPREQTINIASSG
jgi:hypothetical protein